MSTTKITSEVLEDYVNQTYHWKTLPPHQVYAMALELRQLRDAVAVLIDTLQGDPNEDLQSAARAERNRTAQ